MKMEAGLHVDVFVFVAREKVLYFGGSQFVYDGEGASGYAFYLGGGGGGGRGPRPSRGRPTLSKHPKFRSPQIRRDP